MGNVLITCTSPRCHELASRLPNAIANPALILDYFNPPLPAGKFDAVLVTSAHIFYTQLPDIPMICVGEVTAQIAKDNEYNIVQTGKGGITDLDLSNYKNILYPCAVEPTDIPNNCTPWPVYQTRKNPDFNIEKDNEIVCVFSIKAATIINQYDLDDKIILCLSPAIMRVFSKSSTKKLAACTYPRYDTMLQLIAQYQRNTYMSHTDGLKNVNKLINRFGGMRPMARKVDVPVSTIQGWKKRDYIPSERVDEIITAAKKNNVSMDEFDVETVKTNSANENITQPSPAKTITNDEPLISKPKTAENTAQAKPKTPHENNNGFIDGDKLGRDITTRSILTTVSILAVIGGLGYVLFANDVKNVRNMASQQGQIENQVSAVETKYDSFETTVTEGLNSLNSQVTDIAAAVGIQRNSDGELVLNNNLSLGERLTGLESRLRASGEEIDLGQMMTKFQSLTQAVDENGNLNDTAMTDLQGMINSLQARIGDIDASLAKAKAENAELAKSLENVTGRDISAAAMLMAMTQMRSSLNREQPFQEDLNVLQQLVGNDDPQLTTSINRLAPYAESGVLSPEGLSNELRAMTGDIISAALRGEDLSIKEKIMGRLGQILSVQKDGKPLLGIEEQTVIANAQKALDNGDVKTALAELNKLEGEAAQVAKPVKNQVEGTLNAETTVDLMMKNLLQKLQNPTQVKSMIQNIPSEIQRQSQGQIKGSVDSGLIILE